MTLGSIADDMTVLTERFGHLQRRPPPPTAVDFTMDVRQETGASTSSESTISTELSSSSLDQTGSGTRIPL